MQNIFSSLVKKYHDKYKIRVLPSYIPNKGHVMYIYYFLTHPEIAKKQNILN